MAFFNLIIFALRISFAQIAVEILAVVGIDAPAHIQWCFNSLTVDKEREREILSVVDFHCMSNVHQNESESKNPVSLSALDHI